MNRVTKEFQVPTPEEMRVIEAAARRAQIEEMRRLAAIAANGARRLAVLAFGAIARLRRRPATVARHGA